LSPAATTTSKPLRADARRNREKVLDAARKAFATEGLEVQMEAIARRAEVGVGTVYRHFPTKEALLEALWAAKMERIIGLTRRALENPDPWEGVVEMFERGTEMQAADLGWCEALGLRPGGLTAATAPRELLEATNELLERAKRAGGLREDFGFDDVSRVFCATAGVIAAQGPEARHGLLRVILDGLRPPPNGLGPRKPRRSVDAGRSAKRAYSTRT
jgi:AcrR family transcriptional regulator